MKKAPTVPAVLTVLTVLISVSLSLNASHYDMERTNKLSLILEQSLPYGTLLVLGKNLIASARQVKRPHVPKRNHISGGDHTLQLSEQPLIPQDCHSSITGQTYKEWQFERWDEYTKLCGPIKQSGCMLQERTPSEVVRTFCELSRSWFSFPPLWNTPEQTHKTLDLLVNTINSNYKFRKKRIRPLEKTFKKGYINKQIHAYRQMLWAHQAEIRTEQEAKHRHIQSLKELDQDGIASEHSDALHQTIQNPEAEQYRLFEVSDHVEDVRFKHRLQNCMGNPLQRAIHGNLVEHVNDIKNLSQNNTDAPNLKNYANTICEAVDTALEFLKEKKYKQAYSLLDFCKSILDIATHTVKTAVKGVSKGVRSFAQNVQACLNCFFRHPIKTVHALASGSLQSLDTAFSYLVELYAWHAKLQNPTLYARIPKKDGENKWMYYARAGLSLAEEMHAASNGAMGKINETIKELEEDPQQAAVNGIAVLTEAVLISGLVSVGLSQAKRIVKPMVKTIKHELLHTKTGQSLAKVLRESYEIIDLAIKDKHAKPLGAYKGKTKHSKVDKVIQETLQSKRNITSKFTLSANEALELGEKFLGPGYKEIGKPNSGVFRSNGGKGDRIFRIDSGSLAGSHDPYMKHVHLEVLKPDGKTRSVNNHILFKE